MSKFLKRVGSRIIAALIGIVVVIVFGIQFVNDDDFDDQSEKPKKSPAVKFLVFTWNHLPIPVKFFFSKCNETLYETKASRFFINPYVKINYPKNYLQHFRPPQGMDRFLTFQDFFMREFKILPQINSTAMWPCEGLVCDKIDFSDNNNTSIKGEIKQTRIVFGGQASAIPADYQFINIFLHNRDYHHIHAPISGRIDEIEVIHGDLIFLRPWLYKKNPTKPAMINERVVMKITSLDGEPWWLSIVGGPAVGTVEIPSQIKLNTPVNIGDMIASFRLGSTCCLAIPPQNKCSAGLGERVRVFAPMVTSYALAFSENSTLDLV